MRLGFAGIIAVGVLALELVGIYHIGQRIGLWWTLLWLIAGVFAGVSVMRNAGAGLMPRLAAALQQGREPFGVLWATGRRFLAGLLLILPGAGSDILALLLLLWPSPRLPTGKPPDPARRAQRSGDEVIEGEFRRED